METKQKDLTYQFIKESNAIEGVFDALSIVQATDAWNFILSKDGLSDEIILETHRILMDGKLPEKYLGKYRTIDVYIGGKKAPAPEFVPSQMEAWINQANRILLQEDMVNQEEQIKSDHISFEHTHPFVDGNGRIGRILLNWQRVKSGLPILVIYNDEKQDYYSWFK